MSKVDAPRWNLSDLYANPDDPKLLADLEGMPQRAAALQAKYQGKIAVPDLQAEFLAEALAEFADFFVDRHKPGAYASLLFTTRTTDPVCGALLQRCREVGSLVNTHLVFFDLEIARIPDARFAEIIEADCLQEYRYYLNREREQGKHYLSEAEEGILVKTANCRGSAFARLSTELGARAKYQVGDKQMGQSETLSLLYSPDREVRQQAAEAVTATMKGQAHVGTFIFNTMLHEKEVMDNLRGHTAPANARHLANDLDPAVVQTVVDVCVANFATVEDYYALKGQLLGIDDLTHYDRYAPMGDAEQTFSYEDARDLILDAFAEFSPKLREMTVPFFEENWIDAQVDEGKQGGAYCSPVTPDLHPYVFMNYTGKGRDVMTLAHELGHGVHDVLAARNNPYNYYPVLPLAETASTFAEMLVFDRLLAQLESPEDRLALLCDKIENSFATVYRQISMYRFEERAHALRREKGEQSTEAYNALWQEAMSEMFGDSLEMAEGHAWWWLYIPHIVHTPFYVYAYSFGELLVYALYARYKEQGDAFIEGYFELLASGGCNQPAKLVAALGIDIADSAFWQGGCDLIAARVAEAKRLASELRG
jgi:oligoendopeptidase F